MDNVFAESTMGDESDDYSSKPPCGSKFIHSSTGQDVEIAIIEEALSEVRQIRGLEDDAIKTETWTASGEILSCHGNEDFIRKGQGVVGRAFSSKSACFCRDIRQLSITAYPLVVKTRSLGYSACFAVCLQSSCSNNCIYVLEFFLPTYEEDEDEVEADYGDLRTLLNSLMETLKECLGSSFKIALGQELGQKLTVEVIKVSPKDEFDSFEICSTTGIGGEGMTKLQMAPFSAEGLGPCELSYSHSFNNYYHQWVFLSTCGNDEGRCGNPHHLSATADGAVIKDQIIRLLQLVMEAISGCQCLVQFWGLVKIDDKKYLTTHDQPFALQYHHFSGRGAKKLCEYRKHCLKYSISVDEDDEIGPPGRVFRSGLPEYAWNVYDYTSREYPQRDYAVGRVSDYWALPIYHHPTQHLPTGVLEIVSPFVSNKRIPRLPFVSNKRIPRHQVLEKLQNLPWEVNLTTTRVSLPAEVNSCQDGEIAIIEEALSEVKDILGVEDDDTKTWTISGEILSSHGVDINFIRKGQGVVGRAFSSKSACFCRDVRQLSITDYPSVPIVRRYNYSAYFAVCLQSPCSNKCIYVLEFFIPTNEEDEDEDEDEAEADNRDPRTLLNSIMETLKEHLGSSFKIASGQELGQKLTVEVIKVSPEDEFSFEICSTTGIESQPRLEEAQGGDVMMQLDFSSQQVDTANAYINVQLTGIFGSPPRPEHEQGLVNISYQELNHAGVDVAHNSMNDIYEQQNEIVRSTSTTGQELVQNMVSIAHDEPIVEDPEREGAGIEQRDNEVTNLEVQKRSCPLKSKLGITREVLEQNSWRKLVDAAKHIGVSRSTLKRICREYDIKRWPPGKARKVSQALAVQKTVQPSMEDTHEHHRSDATRLEDDNGMWVKAEYQGRLIKFRLPFSARKIDLEENVVKQLNLAMGSFIIEYQDEDSDRIWITCDEVLRTAMSTLSSLGRTTIKMYIVEDSPSKRDQ